MRSLVYVIKILLALAFYVVTDVALVTGCLMMLFGEGISGIAFGCLFFVLHIIMWHCKDDVNRWIEKY